jgi:hypothetical protein
MVESNMKAQVEVPAPSNPAVDTAEGVSQSVFTIAIELALQAVYSRVPLLALPVIKEVFSWVIKKFSSYVYEELRTMMVFAIISNQIENKKEQYDEAVVELKKAQQSGDQAEHEKAKQKFKDDLRKLVRHGDA